MNVNILGFLIKTHKTSNEKFQFLNNRIMNARSIIILTKTKSIHILIPMPSLFYQKWNNEKGWVEYIPTKYNLFFAKANRIFNK